MARAENIVTSLTVEINAPARVVWDVLIDLDNYHQWNSFCPHIQCGLQIGDEVHMQVRNPATGETVPVFEYLVACDPERLLSWEQRPVPENMDAARRDQYIEAIDANRCRYFTTDIFLGLNQDTIMREHGAWVKTAFDQVALDLKRRAEALHANGA
ncbi:SRPBCC domain-containing protein [Pseudomonas sp. 14P_8.1_Bac3]|uniref:SRPBCC domain-containing protein n=1 Tax=Pseudomonas sp. 14P_8.1_Bac3 TaxID=2971621 RepID=UPI0021C8EC65|nr:SRPBCC domain-containing protein [Pseudomonas sp. 14P_8.1_Bac3]MCU1758640.1 SRPBCC domain-containing protein [Pseudomonas sp. 14P_8.1_Bac3]